MNVFVNGKVQVVDVDSSVLDIVEKVCGSPVPTGVAVALNSMVVPRRQWGSTTLENDTASKYYGHPVEDKCIPFMHLNTIRHDPFQLGELTLHSRVLLGTSRYPNQQMMLDCLEASGTEMVTISLRRVPTHTT